MSIESLLREEIQDELNDLKKMELGTEEYKITVEGITKLVDRVVDMEKFDLEHQEKLDSRAEEYDLKVKQMKEDQKSRWINYGISVLGIGIPAGLTIWGTLKSLKFEETGTVTTIVGRGFINKFVPKK